MKAVIQRVLSAHVLIKNQPFSSIQRGLVILLGVERNDTEEDAQNIVEKIKNLRIFNDAAEKMNLSVCDIRGELLIVSQFTLAADIQKGRRPSFDSAATPENAEHLYGLVVSLFQETRLTVATGKFGALMHIALVNDGPVTFFVDTRAKTADK